MSFTPKTWGSGDTVTSSDLRRIENGIANAGGVLICNSSYSSTVGEYVLDKTVQEIYNALLDGTPVYIKHQYGTISDYVGTLYLAPVIKVYNYDSTNVIRIVASKPTQRNQISGKDNIFGAGTVIYSATGLNQYPAYYASVVGINASQELTNIN